MSRQRHRPVIQRDLIEGPDVPGLRVLLEVLVGLHPFEPYAVSIEALRKIGKTEAPKLIRHRRRVAPALLVSTDISEVAAAFAAERIRQFPGIIHRQEAVASLEDRKSRVRGKGV